jgi:hypothetical protein
MRGNMTDCTHESFGYFPAVNEEGWKCFNCGSLLPGEPDGYRPDLDRSHTDAKVYGLLNDLHENKFIYVSNGAGGDILTNEVVKQCQRSGLYDQISIIQYILALGESEHAAYWKEIGDGVVNGNDKRERCHCGKLATSFGSKGNRCSEHWNLDFAVSRCVL